MDLRGRTVEQELMLRVDVLDVVQLLEVVEHRLPVAPEAHGLVGNQGHRVETVRPDDVDHRAEEVLEGWGGRVHADPHHPERASHAHGLEGALGPVHPTGEPVVVRHHHETTIGPVAPAVVRTGEVLLAATLVHHDARAAVLADVVVSDHVPVLGARHEDRLAGDVEHDVLTRLGDVALEARELPHGGPEHVVLAGQPRLGDVALRGDGPRLYRWRAVDDGWSGLHVGHRFSFSTKFVRSWQLASCPPNDAART